ncbi:excisionase family DNA-binding protein [Streptomyces sp. NPDC059142]|uniref:excisionase family DNA-binding protein n=1 Tax=Streptomyces sp. NPDC059142 TaxID=3346739 RepID=UPI0036C1C08F
MADRLLTVQQVAERLGTGVRFARRLIEERRIEYVKVGRHVRISERAVDAYVTVNTVRPALRRLRSVA